MSRRELVVTVAALLFVAGSMLISEAIAGTVDPGSSSAFHDRPSRAIEETVWYQGFVADAVTGEPLSTVYDIVATIYDDPAVGSVVWGPENHLNVPITEGWFGLELGSIVSLPGFESPPYYLELIVNGETLDPRQKLASVPSAFQAGTADIATEIELPYYGEVTSGNHAFHVTNDGSGVAGYFEVNNPSSTAGAVYGWHNGPGPAVLGWAVGSGPAIKGSAATGLAGEFVGDVEVQGALEADSFVMSTGASHGLVLTSDVSGHGSWQPTVGNLSGGGTDGRLSRWSGTSTLGNSVLYQGGDGVAIGTTSPTATLFEVNHNSASDDETVRFTRSVPLDDYNTILRLHLPAGSEDNSRLLECSHGSDYPFMIDADGDVTCQGGQFTATRTDAQPTGYFTSEYAADFTQILEARWAGSEVSNHITTLYSECDVADGYGTAGDFYSSCIGVYGLGDGSTPANYFGVYGDANSFNGTNHGVHGYAYGQGTNVAVYAYAHGGVTNWAGYFRDDVYVEGGITYGTASMKIDNPADPANEYLNHSAVGSPEMKNVYDGVTVLDASGAAWVEMPDWFEALNTHFRYQLTCIGGYAPVYIAEEIASNRFRIAGGQSGMKVSWMVTGVRHDPYAEAHPMEAREAKPADKRGKYQRPELYGLPESADVDYDPGLIEQRKIIDQKREARMAGR